MSYSSIDICVTKVLAGISLSCCLASLLYFPTMAQSPLFKATTSKFSLHLHEVLLSGDPEQNLFYSPSSILVALAMTFLGARGNTARQMITSFHLDEMPEESIKQEFQSFLQSLNKTNANGNHIAMANRLFAQMGFEIVQKFQDETSQFFNAQLAMVDYMKNAEGARAEVNEWVEKQTNGKITNLIPDGMFTPLTRLTLVNAVYFKGSWMNRFDPNATQTGKFHVTPSKEIDVQMMYQSEDFKYIEDQDLNCQIIELPYSGGKMSMIIFLPNEVDGLSKLEKSLTYDRLAQALTNLKATNTEEVEVFLPKFKLTNEFSLKEMLTKMGAVDMFSQNQADFSGISTSDQLHVSEVVHKAFVDVNEEGTEAAAATGVGMAAMSMPMNPEFNANHPFLFLIHHNDSGAVLFLGRMAKPPQ